MSVIINATPHNVDLLGNDKKLIATFPCSDLSLRLGTKVISQRKLKVIVGTKTVTVPVTSTEFIKKVCELPPFKADVFYIVSQLVKVAFPGRRDLLVPTDVIRNSAGAIIGCRALGL